MNRPMLIVLEGLDGAGKSTQVHLLQQWLTKRNINSEYLHFPRFDAPIYGELIARFLRGEFGNAETVNPYLVALIYACDRADAVPQLQQWLDEGKTIILDRYVYSNVGYQCAKLPAGEERDRLAKWILELEFGHNQLPQPDISLFLDVPFDFTKHKLSEQRKGDDRNYLNGAHDIHEDSLSLQQRVREVYLNMAQDYSIQTDYSTLHVVDCSTPDGTMAPPKIIFDKIIKEVKQIYLSKYNRILY